jgi:hypothetical protein
MPATPSARMVAVSAATKNWVWNVARARVMRWFRIQQLIAETASP